MPKYSLKTLKIKRKHSLFTENKYIYYQNLVLLNKNITFASK